MMMVEKWFGSVVGETYFTAKFQYAVAGSLATSTAVSQLDTAGR